MNFRPVLLKPSAYKTFIYIYKNKAVFQKEYPSTSVPYERNKWKYGKTTSSEYSESGATYPISPWVSFLILFVSVEKNNLVVSFDIF